MKRLILLTGVLIFTANFAQAGILSNVFGGYNNYNNGYYYPPNVRYMSGNCYHSRPYYYNYYQRPYYNNSYNPYGRSYYNNQPNVQYIQPYGGYYGQPVIYRTKVNRKSSIGNNEKLVASQFSGIEKLENQLLLQTYEYDNAKNRIERLEQRLFGASQEGELAQRFETLKLAARNYKTFNPNIQNYSSQSNYRPPVFTGMSGGGWRNTLLGNFKNQFTGMPTGITPAMDPAYMDYFEAERAMAGNGEEVGVQTNRGYYYSNRNRGTGTGVTILD